MSCVLYIGFLGLTIIHIRSLFKSIRGHVRKRFVVVVDKLVQYDTSVRASHRVVIRSLVPGIFVYNVRGIRNLWRERRGYC